MASTARSATARVTKAIGDPGQLETYGNGLVILGGSDLGGGRSQDAIAWQREHLEDAAYQYHLYAKGPWVRTCVDYIAQAATADEYGIKSESEDETGITAVRTWLAQINPTQSFDRLLRTIYRDRQINGNSYVRIQRAPDGTLAALHRIDFRTIVARPEPSGPVKVYDLFPNGRWTSTSTPIPAADIWHSTLNDSGPNGGGLAPLESLDATLANDMAALKYNTGFFRNGVKAGDVYAIKDDMDPIKLEREREYLLQNFTDPAQSHSPLFLNGQIAMVRDGASLHKDMEFVALHTWNREEVSAVFSVPLSLITAFSGSLGGNGKEQDQVMFDENVIAPEQKAVFEDFNRVVMLGALANSDITILAPNTTKIRLDRLQAAELMTHVGASGNQALKVLNLPPVDGMDEPLYMGGRQLWVVGKPGDPDSVLLTAKGAMSAEIQDPEDINGTKQPPAGLRQPPVAGSATPTAPGMPVVPAPVASSNTPVKKAEDETPEWFRQIVKDTASRLAENLGNKSAHLAREIGANRGPNADSKES